MFTFLTSRKARPPLPCDFVVRGTGTANGQDADDAEPRESEARRIDARRERYLALSRLSSDWFWDQDAEFRFVDVDADTDEYGGLVRAVHLGKTRWELPYTEPVGTTWELHRAELEAHRPFRNLLLRRSTPTGVRYVNVSGEPVFATDGVFAGYRGVASDVSERLEAEQALVAAQSALAERASEQEHAAFLKALLDALPMGVSLVDENLTVVAANPACARLLGVPSELFQPGKSLEDLLIHDAQRGALGPGDERTLVSKHLASERSGAASSFEQVSEGRNIEVRAVPLPNGSIVKIYLDVTEQRLAEDDLRKARDAAEAASQAKSAFLAVMSHEIRTPMNAVIGLLELLRLGSLDAEQRDTIDTIRDSSKSLLRLIDDVLDFSKIEAGRLELREEATSISEMFKRAHLTFGSVASQKGVLFDQSVDTRIAKVVVVDRLRLRQIINNLLSNAIKFTERGQVELTARLVGRDELIDTVRIVVRDTGVGIDSRVFDRLFQPFSQADASIERRYGGTGLGLAICKRLAELMGTTIDVQSTPGVGTSFGLTLRLRRASGAELVSAKPPDFEVTARAVVGRVAPTVEAARAEGRLVLVVDDHPVNRRMLARQLNTLGYAVQTACDGREALDVLSGGGFGALFTDCQMPVMDGLQLASAIRLAEAGGSARLPIIACTANVSQEALDQCRSVGMDEALTKPIELSMLKQILDRWLASIAVPEVEQRTAPLASDFAMLDELADGDAALQRDVLEDFRVANAQDLKTAERAVNSVSIDELRRAAHSIKGAARTVGANPLARAAAALEQAAHAGDWQRVSSCWPALQQESLRLDQRIATECDDPL